MTISYAASSTLAKQIENGAPADLFISADEDWMDYLQHRNLINPETRIDLLGNSLVLIAPQESTARVEIVPGFAARRAARRRASGDGRPQRGAGRANTARRR